jgi:hypothetical protein
MAGSSKAMKTLQLLSALGVAASLPASQALSMPSAELTKKCREMMLKAYPRLAAGTKAGNAQQQRSYFQTCVARGGETNSTAAPERRSK